MRKWLLMATCIPLAGCGVSKELYQAEVVRSQEVEARATDLATRLELETRQRQAAESAVQERDAEIKALKSEIQRSAARGDDLEARLTACTEREAGLRADLDLSHRDRASMKSDLDRVRGDLEAGRSIWGAEKNRLQEDLEAARGRIADLETQISVLTEQKERLELEKREKLEEISRTYEGLLEGMKEEVEKGRVTISQLRGKLSVNLLDEILFDSGSTVIKPEGRDVLKRLGELLGNAADKAIVIEGHTDDVPISGELARRFPTNWELSTARAGSVVRYLQESAGIEPERLSAVGFGPYRPVASNDTVDGRARNRRIEVKLVPLEAPLFTPSQTRPEDTEPASEETAGD